MKTGCPSANRDMVRGGPRGHPMRPAALGAGKNVNLRRGMHHASIEVRSSSTQKKGREWQRAGGTGASGLLPLKGGNKA